MKYINRMLFLRCRGLNQQEIANDLDLARITVHRQFTKFKSMPEEEFADILYNNFSEAFRKKQFLKDLIDTDFRHEIASLIASEIKWEIDKDK